jgi:perosamine synthetase
VEYVADAARHGWGGKHRDYIDRFEEGFKSHIGARFAIATSSCTGALHLGLDALGIGPGDEVIMADSNWVATAAPVVHLGAAPVFVDIEQDSWCVDPAAVEAAITPRTKAIVAVHLYGNLCDMTSLLSIGKRHGIPVIEDAAEAIGSTYLGKPAGGMGVFGVFSFHGTKTLSTGEGGMFVTSDGAIFESVLTLSNHGRRSNEVRQFWPSTVGYKFKMSNIQAALGCAQLERIESLVERKRQILEDYKAEFRRRSLEVYAFNSERAGCRIGAWMTTVVLAEPNLNSEILADVFGSLKRSGVDARPFFSPLTSTPPFLRAGSPDFRSRWSYRIPPVALNLPSAHDLTRDEIEHVVSAVIDGLP